MQLDWLTIAAQIVNFLILIWLLQRFLYAPITDAMARREERIQNRMAAALKGREEAEQEAETLRQARQALAESQDAEIRLARKEADALRAKLQAEIREEIGQRRLTWLAQLKEDRADVMHDIRDRLYQQVFDVVRRVLADFADTSITHQLANVFIDRLAALDKDERDRLSGEAADLKDHAVVESGLDLPPESRSRVTRAIHKHVADGLDVDYGIDTSLLLGIRLTLGDLTIEWSAARHLKHLETAVSEAIEAELAEARR
ncbi:F0F1 ATP synthase subunit B family protein [Arenibacterium sp. CAU 1754]